MIAKKVENYLVPLLGPNTARIAVRTFAATLKKKSEELTPGDLAPLAQSMHGMLKTLLGNEVAEKALKEIPQL
jgi:hypothetical protein